MKYPKIYDEREEKFVELIIESPKAWSEIKSNGGEILKYPTTINNVRKRLLKRNIIELIDVEDPSYDRKYRLTDDYRNLLGEKKYDSFLNRLLDNQLEWQSTFNKLIHYLEFEYPILINQSSFFNFKEIYSDVFNYMVHFNLSNLKITGDSKRYWDFVLYLVINHPDQKYSYLINKIDLNRINFHHLIVEFKETKELEDFSIKTADNNLNKHNYLISEDPILHNIKQKIEAIFPRFFVSWQFPDVNLEENFDFFLQFSFHILNIILKSQTDIKISKFINNFRICFLIFIREIIYEKLVNLSLKNAEKVNLNEYPTQLLLSEQKKELRKKLITSPKILTSNDRKNIAAYYLSEGKEEEEKKRNFEKGLRDLADEISYYEDNQKSQKDIIYLKSHLLLLVRLCYKYDERTYELLNDLLVSTYKNINFEYSILSEEIFTGIRELNIGLKPDSSYNEKYFSIKNLLERIDHLKNTLNTYEEEDLIKIREVFNLAIKNFSEKVSYPFFKKKIELFNDGIEIYSQDEIKRIIGKTVELNPFDYDLLDILFDFLIKTKDIDFFNKIIQKNQWSTKIKIEKLKKYIHKLPSNFKVGTYFNSITTRMKNKYFMKDNFDNNDLIDFLKIHGYYMKHQNKNLNALLIYYFASELELKARKKTSILEGLIELIKCWEKKESNININFPSIMLLLQIKVVNENFNQNSFNKLDSISKILYNSILQEEFNENLEKIYKSLPYLIDGIKKLVESFSQIFKNAIKNQDNSTDERDIRKSIISYIKKDIKLKKELDNSKKEISSFTNKITTSNYRKIHNFLNYLTDEKFFKNTKKLSNNEYLDKIFSNIDQEIKPEKSQESQLFNNNMIASGSLDFYALKTKSYNDYSISLSFENLFKPSKKEIIKYPFRMAFGKKLNVDPKLDSISFDNKKKLIGDNSKELIEFLDIVIFARFRFDLENLEDISVIILDLYGINWAIRYLNLFRNYFIWYTKRVETFNSNIPEELSQVNKLNQFLKFSILIIKTKLYWKDHNKDLARSCLVNANDLIKDLDYSIQKLKIFNEYKDKLNSYNKKIFI